MSDYDASRSNEEEPEDDLDSTAKFNRDELVRGWRDYEARTPRVVPLLKVAAKTDMGQVRENNEDKFEWYEPEETGILALRGSLFAVADGVGGAQAGQIASEMMLKNLIAGYYDSPAPDVESALRYAIETGNDRVYALAQMIPERNGMGTTLTAAVFIEDKVMVAQLGDSRAYLVRNGQIRQVTQDHSWVEEQVRAGILSRQDAEVSPFRNVITRSIGAGPNVQPDVFVEHLLPGDTWLLCSDGLTTYVEDPELAQILCKHGPSEAARQFIELANARGGRDNITVLIVSVRDIMPFAEGDTRPLSAAQVPSSLTNGGVNTVPHPVRERSNVAAPMQVAFQGAAGGLSLPAPSLPPDSTAPRRSGWRNPFKRGTV